MKIVVSLLFVSGVILGAGFLSENTISEDLIDRGRLDVANFTKDGLLVRPTNVDEWIFLGASVGHGYPEEGGGGQFSMESPGQIQVIQIEPSAYAYFKKNRHFADGTMLSLSFYATQKKPKPAVDGLVQGKLNTFEIHLLDKENFNDERAFYLFSGGESETKMISEGNDCVTCHNSEAHFEGTFTDFYPVARDQILRGGG